MALAGFLLKPCDHTGTKATVHVLGHGRPAAGGSASSSMFWSVMVCFIIIDWRGRPIRRWSPKVSTGELVIPGGDYNPRKAWS